MLKPIKIYVASSWRNALQPEVVGILREEGHEVYDFRNPGPGNIGFSWKKIRPDTPPWSAVETREVLESDVAQVGFDLDLEAMRGADVFVMVQPCGRSAALELGWACGAGRQAVVLLADGQEPELMLKCADRICTSMEQVVHYLRRLRSSVWPTDACLDQTRAARTSTSKPMVDDAGAKLEREKFSIGDPVKFNHPNGSVGRITSIRRDGPFGKGPGCRGPGYYVEWVYGRDARGERMTSGSSLQEGDCLKRIAEEDLLAVENRKGFGK